MACNSTKLMSMTSASKASISSSESNTQESMIPSTMLAPILNVLLSLDKMALKNAQSSMCFNSTCLRMFSVRNGMTMAVSLPPPNQAEMDELIMLSVERAAASSRRIEPSTRYDRGDGEESVQVTLLRQQEDLVRQQDELKRVMANQTKATAEHQEMLRQASDAMRQQHYTEPISDRESLAKRRRAAWRNSCVQQVPLAPVYKGRTKRERREFMSISLTRGMWKLARRGPERIPQSEKAYAARSLHSATSPGGHKTWITGSGAHASPYSFLRMHTVLSHVIVDLRNSIQRNERSLSILQEVDGVDLGELSPRHVVRSSRPDLRTALVSSRRALDTAHAERDWTNDLLQEAQGSLWSLEHGQRDLREQRDQAQARLSDQQAELRDLASQLTVQTEKATKLERRVQETDQALEVMTAEAPPDSGAKGSTHSGPAGAKGPVPPSPSRSAKRPASGGRPGKRKVSRVHAAVPLPSTDPNLPRDVDATYMAVALSKPWEQYKVEESFIRSSGRQLPLWAELQEQLEDFWGNHALAHWNRRFMRGSAEVHAEVEAAMGTLVGIIGCLYRIVRRHGIDLLRFLLPPFVLAGLPSRRGLFEDDGLGLGCSSRAGLSVISRLGILAGGPVHFSHRAVRSPFMATLAFLKGCSLREFWFKKCERVPTRRCLSGAFPVYQGRFPFVVDDRSHPPEGSQWARGMPRPAGIPPMGYTPPLPNTTGVPKTATTSGAPTTFSASGVQSTFSAPEMVDLLSDSATDTDEETVAVDL
ncbi:hypothetical protein H257_12049 [Aphanomyces astaci]|uniref:Uncharacterized protein n=1 Tax=Aphanomyces astaci TaxID=112090 RepID=W4G1S4_APHAT|nr:hypothetical protein H257_12049 [Aphanomyces astaci]ETV73004.1 hypothetical protein H257_12049 [Aphanomyces astaci]|eukprot:XP_009837453.1 hypothetical protein H257_12049 [Aphanomyces astaci]